MKKFIFVLLAIILAIGTLFTVPSAIATWSKAYASPIETAQTITAYHADSTKTFAVNNDLFTFKPYTHTNSKTKASDFSAIEITMSPHSNPGGFLLQKHVVNVPEDFYIQAGEFEFLSFQPSKSIKVSAGDIVRIPVGVPYGYKNVGAEPGKVLIISPSDGLEKFIAEIGTPVSAPSSIPSNSISIDTVQTDINKLASIAQKYGIEFLN